MADRLDAKDLPGNAEGYPRTTSGIINLFEINVDDQAKTFGELSLIDVHMNESLLSASPTITIKATDTVHLLKNLYNWKSKGGQPPNLRISMLNPYIDNLKGVFVDNMKVYRLDNRRLINYHTEEFTLHAIHQTTFANYISRMSDYYKKVELSKVVEDAMTSLGISSASSVEKTDIIRNYTTNNQHPYQVIAEIADMAMKGTRIPYLHYATLENTVGKHHFKSLNTLVTAKSVETYIYNEKGAGKQLTDPKNIMAYEFPCDFDTLLDLSHGIVHNSDLYKDHMPSMISVNPFDSEVYLVDGKSHGSRKTQGFGGVLNSGAWSNINIFETSKALGISEAEAAEFAAAQAAGQQSPAGGATPKGYVGIADQPSQVEKYFHRRSELMTFLHREHVDVKIIVPFAHNRHVGEKINIEFYSKREGDGNQKDFGSGEYLIAHLTHSIKVGSYGTTTLECVKVRDTHQGSEDKRPFNQKLINLLGIESDRGR